jgi:hypothetical protein
VSNLPKEIFVPCKAEHLQATVLPDGRWLLYSPANCAATTLTAAAGILWELCDGRTPVRDLLHQLQEYYPQVAPSHLEQETRQMLHHFMEQGLVVDSAACAG